MEGSRPDIYDGRRIGSRLRDNDRYAIPSEARGIAQSDIGAICAGLGERSNISDDPLIHRGGDLLNRRTLRSRKDITIGGDRTIVGRVPNQSHGLTGLSYDEAFDGLDDRRLISKS